VRGLMRSLGDRMGNRYAESLRDKSIDERLDAVVNILGDGSPLGDWEKTGDGYVLREYDCPYYRVAASHPDVCSFHLQILARVLEMDVRREESMAAGDARCTYHLKQRQVD
jgi:predicted ArsR family transcriptional regulator